MSPPVTEVDLRFYLNVGLDYKKDRSELMSWLSISTRTTVFRWPRRSPRRSSLSASDLQTPNCNFYCVTCEITGSNLLIIESERWRPFPCIRHHSFVICVAETRNRVSKSSRSARTGNNQPYLHFASILQGSWRDISTSKICLARRSTLAITDSDRFLIADLTLLLTY
jgi:hypothetical protein